MSSQVTVNDRTDRTRDRVPRPRLRHHVGHRVDGMNSTRHGSICGRRGCFRLSRVFRSRVEEIGAGDGTRTHDPLLGKQMLYRLSYSRSLLNLIGADNWSPADAQRSESP